MRGGRLDEHNKVSCLLFLVNEASNNKQFESILDAAAAYAKHIVGLVAPSPGWGLALKSGCDRWKLRLHNTV